MPPALLQDGFLEDGLALARVYHVVYLCFCRLPSGHNVCSPFHHFPAAPILGLLYQ